MPTGVYARTPKPLADPLLRFWRYVKKAPGDGCWIWIGGLTHQGYGAFWANGKTLPAHRYLFVRKRGELAVDQLVCHRCDNPKCVRLSHLFVGSQRDNIHDAISKQRFDPQRITRTPHVIGEHHPQSKLTEEQVREIRARYQRGRAGESSPVSLRGLAREYGVSKFAIQYVLKQGWRHLSDVDIV